VPDEGKTGRTLWLCSWLVAVLCLAGYATAQKRFICPNGEVRIAMNPREVAIRYDGTSMAAAIAKVSLFSSELSFADTQLQQAAAATQQWNQLILALINGWNSCAISKEQYFEGVRGIYPKLKEDAAELDTVAGLLSKGQAIHEDRLRLLLARYIEKFRRLAEMSWNSGILGRMSEDLNKVRSNTDEILFQVREIRQTCGEYRVPFQVAERAEVANTPGFSGIAFAEQLSEFTSVTDSVEATFSKFVRTVPASDLTAAGGLARLPFLTGSSANSFPLDQSSRISFTSTSQTTLSIVTLDGRTASLVAGNSNGGLLGPVGMTGNLIGNSSYPENGLDVSFPLNLSGKMNASLPPNQLTSWDSGSKSSGVPLIAGNLSALLTGQLPAVLSTPSQSVLSSFLFDNSGQLKTLALNSTGTLAGSLAEIHGLMASSSSLDGTLSVAGTASKWPLINPVISGQSFILSPTPCTVGDGSSSGIPQLELQRR
jgi:hypothetical protein